ncbi:MAG TPA: hypothetical protein PLR90_03165 [Methylophilus sp.]|jgi:putative effector of murein hydrolase LrgA (UPF0299 family)|nr:hypothetical protein [Methylophilus sp.]HQQ32895.1 hypothetical protein [Methylophilus sp.]
MPLNTFLKIHAIIALIFGLGFLFVPATILSFYTDVELNEAGTFMSRLFASAILTYAAVLWFASYTLDSEAKRAIVKGFFLTMLVGLAVTLHFQLTGPINALGWSTVALYAFLAFSYWRYSNVK